ncbi:glycoside hydrolase family 3 C-terminal domain-containing protein [Rhizobium hainanense]|uniref:Beta-glucosidase n=1 Tax=Rhizobium hainanense TaxID=52131 RepID=A0A1C3W9P8_9HYPH|nr:glycoside hydrolase family 3 C-terminal domain-containing protein [Rhizobium hainanense]SCB36454.1 beta-glucosidase [Rhizobium hainanense]
MDTHTTVITADKATEEALSLATGADYWTTIDATHNGIRSLRFADGPHGLRVQDDENPDHLGIGRSLPATCFPPAVTLASSWDGELIREIGAALGREARAMGVDVVLGPGLNLKRSPLCGRNFEYYSEDPYLGGMLAAAIVDGMQSQGVGACLKHFAVNNQETDRLRVSANVDERALREIYLRTFEVAVRQSRPWAIMSSYNRINGIHAAQNEWLLSTVLREEWGFDGIVVSDWGGVRDPIASLNAGLDLRMPGRQEDDRLRKAYSAGQVEPDTLKKMVERFRLLAERTRRVGESTTVDYDLHNDLVRLAAAESAVLLTNDGTLPMALATGTRVAVIGELARQPRYQGAGSSYVNSKNVVTGLTALRARAEACGAELTFASGYALDKKFNAEDAAAEAVRVAEKADIVILFLGLPGEYEAEGRDRTMIDLPQDQIALTEALHATGKPIVVAMSNGSAVTTSNWRNNVNAIVEFWLTGQAHGNSVADVLLGDINPSGKLPETIPLRLADTPSYLHFPGVHGNVSYGEGIYVGYRYYDARGIAVDHPFGHGLSYTTFDFVDLDIIEKPLEDPVAFVARVTVRNTGAREGAEVVQLYVADHNDFVDTPPRELRGWKKIRLDPGQSGIVEIAVPRQQLEHWNELTRTWLYPGGPVTVHVGSSSRDIRLKQSIDLPGHPVLVPLTPWSTTGEWLDDPVGGPMLQAIFDSRGGLRGRMGDLMSDPAGRDSARGIPLASIAEFPGVPIDMEEIEALARTVASKSAAA